MASVCRFTADLTVDIHRYRIFGRVYGFSDEPLIVRLLLKDIGVEASVVAHPVGVATNVANELATHEFHFDGDIVRASVWLRDFELVTTARDGSVIPIDFPSGFMQTFRAQNLGGRIFGNSVFAGRSWLFENREEFVGKQFGTLPTPGFQPVFGVLGAAFGDSMWFDEFGAPSAKGILDRIPDVFAAMLIRKCLILLIDMSNEGQPILKEWMFLLHSELDRRGIPSRQCVILQQNRNLPAQYDAWIAEQRFEPMRILAYDYYPRRMVGYLSRFAPGFPIDTATRSKLFTCLNFTPRPNRTTVVSWLLGHDFAKHGYVSFGAFDNRKKGQQYAELCDWFPDIEAIQRGFHMLLQRAPLVLDLDPENQSPPEFDLGPDYIYTDSYFSIVTETEISGGDMVRITEKTIKPLAMYHPVIVVGNPFCLEILRELGFKTFDGFFDESYDLVLDPLKRIELVMEEIRKKLAMSSVDLHSMYWKLWPVLAYNAAHARRVLDTLYKYQIEPEIIDQIGSAQCDVHMTNS